MALRYKNPKTPKKEGKFFIYLIIILVFFTVYQVIKNKDENKKDEGTKITQKTAQTDIRQKLKIQTR